MWGCRQGCCLVDGRHQIDHVGQQTNSCMKKYTRYKKATSLIWVFFSSCASNRHRKHTQAHSHVVGQASPPVLHAAERREAMLHHLVVHPPLGVRDEAHTTSIPLLNEPRRPGLREPSSPTPPLRGGHHGHLLGAGGPAVPGPRDPRPPGVSGFNIVLLVVVSLPSRQSGSCSKRESVIAVRRQQH